MPNGFPAVKSSSMIATKPKGFSTKKDTSSFWRHNLFKGKLGQSVETKLSFMKFPTLKTLAGTSVFRFMDPKIPLNYFQLFSQLPPSPGRGADSPDNRWSGRNRTGGKGSGGSYWGSIDGISAERFFYSCIKGYDPKAGVLLILPSMVPFVITGLQNRLPYCSPEELDIPPELSFSGSYNVNIVVGKTICNIETVNMDVMSAQFQEWTDRVTRLLRGELDDLELKDFVEAIEHGEFKEISRLVGNLACAKGHKALAAKSVRRGDLNAPAYNPDNANTLVILGQDGEPITKELVGKCVIKVRPNLNPRGSGADATIEPMSVYPSPPNSEISPYNPPESRLLVIRNTESKSNPTSRTLTGPSGQILSNSTQPIGDEGLKALAPLAELAKLQLSSNSIGDQGAKALAPLAELAKLQLSSNSIGDAGLKALAPLAELAKLQLSGNSIGDQGLKALAPLTELAKLQLSSNSIGDQGLKALAPLTELAKLQLSSNSIGDQGAKSLAAPPHSKL